MQRTLFLLFLLLCGLKGYAQVPGYLGKKFTIDATIHSFPAVAGPTANNKSLALVNGSFAFNWRAVGTLGYTISRTRQLVLVGDVLRTGLSTNLYGAPDPFDPFYRAQRTVFYELSGKTIGFGLRTYKPTTGAIAPFGVYNAWTLQATFLNATPNDEYSGYNVSEEYFEEFDPKFTFWALTYELGQNFVIKDILVLNLGVRLNIPLQLNLINIEEEVFETNQEIFDHDVFSRMAKHSLLTINVGAGVVF